MSTAARRATPSRSCSGWPTIRSRSARSAARPCSASSIPWPSTSRARASTTPTTAPSARRASSNALRRRAPTSTTTRWPPRRRRPTRSPRTRSPRPSPSPRSRPDARLLAVQEPRDLAALLIVADHQAGAAAGGRHRARRLEHPCRRRAADRQPAEQPRERRAAHVAAQRLGRVPRDPRQADERADAQQPRLHRLEDLLLATRAGAVVLARVAEVLARPRQCERLLAV